MWRGGGRQRSAVHETHDQCRRENRQLPQVHPEDEHRGKGEAEHRDGLTERDPKPGGLDPARLATLPATEHDERDAHRAVR
jgi:hypothetical protein